jgi:hypothetical protein
MKTVPATDVRAITKIDMPGVASVGFANRKFQPIFCFR